MADGEGGVPTSLSTGDRDWIERLVAARVEEVARSRPPPPATQASDGRAPEGSTAPTAAMIPSSGSTAVGGSFSPPCSLPEKLIMRIHVLDLEFIDMFELIPDNWRFNAGTDEGMCCHHSRKQRRGPVVDILLWVECYSTLVSVLSSKFPLKIPDLMAYQRTIVYAHRSFAGDGWVTYDLSYRRRAALPSHWTGVKSTLTSTMNRLQAEPVWSAGASTARVSIMGHTSVSLLPTGESRVAGQQRGSPHGPVRCHQVLAWTVPSFQSQGGK